ncbi:MAG: hypothetical protein HRT69_16020 [Flavobacteriaceae bacterium]|nr:hypothetical protein [Flavobacteriaceae bacterium]
MEENNSKIKQRILEYAKLKGFSKRKIYIDTGISNGILDKPTGLTESNIERFLSTYNEVNPTWFVTGIGGIMKSDSHNVSEPTTSYNRVTGIDAQFEEMFARYLKSPKAKNEIKKIVATQISGITDKLGLLILDNEIKAEIEKAIAENLKEQEVKQ